MAIEEDWHNAFRKHKTGSDATADRAWRTWTSLRAFCIGKKWDFDPKTITPKQVRLYLESRSGVGKGKVSDRTIQNEASHIRRALRGAGRDVPDDRGLRLDKDNAWSSKRLSVPESSRIGGKAAADLAKWQEAKPLMPRDILVTVNLIEAMGFRKKEAVMSGESLKEWGGELLKPSSLERGCYVNVIHGTKGGRPRFQYVPAKDVPAALQAVTATITEAALHKEFPVEAGSLKSAMSRFSNCLSRLGLSGEDSGHGLRRAFAQRQYAYYRDSGLNEKQALSRLSVDLGHGDKRGRWVWNNYLLGGSGDTA